MKVTASDGDYTLVRLIVKKSTLRCEFLDSLASFHVRSTTTVDGSALISSPSAYLAGAIKRNTESS